MTELSPEMRSHLAYIKATRAAVPKVRLVAVPNVLSSPPAFAYQV
jgi:hypothetical protein